MNEREIWDSEAAAAVAKFGTQTGQPYVGRVHLKAAETALRYANVVTPCVLKADLWNEGIELDRDILGMLERNGSLSLFGVEISAVVCHRAKTRLEKTEIIQGDLRSMPIKDGSFDVLLDFSTIDHIVPSQIPTVIREYQRALKKSGIMLMTFWYPARILQLIGVLGRVSYPQYYLDTKRMKALIGEGFDILDEYRTVGWGAAVLPQMKRAEGRLSGMIHDLILRFEYSRFSKLLLKDFGGVLIIVARKR